MKKFLFVLVMLGLVFYLRPGMGQGRIIPGDGL